MKSLRVGIGLNCRLGLGRRCDVDHRRRLEGDLRLAVGASAGRMTVDRPGWRCALRASSANAPCCSSSPVPLAIAFGEVSRISVNAAGDPKTKVFQRELALLERITEFVINMQTVRLLCIEVPQTLLALADKVID
jgi:hypothetical protein